MVIQRKLQLSVLMAAALLTSGLSSFANAQATASPPPALERLEEQLFLRAYHHFLSDVRSAHPELNLGTTAFSPPPFDSTLGRNDWLEKFPDWTLRQRQAELKDDAAAVAKLSQPVDVKTITDELFSSYYQNKRYAHFSAIESVQPAAVTAKETALLVRRDVQPPQSWPGDHTLDLNSYVAQRFPVELQNFVQSVKAPLILDDSSCAAAYALQKSEGYSHAVKFMGDHDSPDSQFMIVYNDASPVTFHFLVCQIRGHDDETRMVEMVGPFFKQNGVQMLHHRRPEPLSHLNAQGLALKIGPEDLVVIGYQNSVWWKVSGAEKNKDWRRDLLTSAGAEVDIFANARTGKRIISLANVYGDEMLAALKMMWAKGARRFVYLGTAGALDPQLNIGDVLLPESFQDLNGQWFSFANNAVSRSLTAPTPSKVYPSARQGWVATLIDETKPHIHSMQSSGVQAIDVEAKYFAAFLKNKACEKMVVITISDTPLGRLTFDQEAVTRQYPIHSAEMIIDELLKDAKFE